MAGADPEFEDLLLVLRAGGGLDLTGYKRSSLVRRVQRRMQLVGVGSYGDYRDFLKLHPDEFTALSTTVLINVTRFFRDEDAWSQLRESLLPALVRGRPEGVLRVWCAGCASGEEAYSLAICLAELLGPEEFRERVRISTTDVDEEALARARRAVFDEQQLRGVPPELLDPYFESRDGRYTVRTDLRRSVSFARNDLVHDVPMSGIDLLSCRNTLMYLEAGQQARIVGRLHAALHPHGLLFTGRAETLLGHTALFRPVDPRRGFFRKVLPQRRPDAPAELPDRSRLRDEALLAGPVAQLVVDADGNLALVNERAGALFGIGPRDIGRPFRDVARSSRLLELHPHLDRALAERRPVRVHDVEWPGPPGHGIDLDVQVVPLFGADGAGAGVSLSFDDVTALRRLQLELEHANRQLGTAYEELQSMNEELETMNEEVQSMYDELQSGNDELLARTAEVGELSHVVESVLGRLGAVVVVDRDLRVLAWNDRAADLLGLRRAETRGRRLPDLDLGLPVERLHALLRRLLADEGAATDPELTIDAMDRRGRPIAVRVTGSPLRGARAEVTGAILVFEPPAAADGPRRAAPRET